MSDETIRIKVYAETYRVESRSEVEVDIPREEWEEMNAAKRDDFARELLADLIKWGYEAEGE